MATNTSPATTDAPVQASLYALLASFTGYRYRFLLALIKDPTRSYADVCRELGIEPQTAWNWHSMVPGFKEALDAIKEDRPQLRQEYAKLAFEGAIPGLVDKMIEVGQTDKRDAQRARERILEATGVLQKEPLVIINEPSRDMLEGMKKLMSLAMSKAVSVEAPIESIEAKVTKALGTGEQGPAAS